MMFGFLVDTQKESLRKENAELRKELTEIRQKELLKEILSPFLQSKPYPGTNPRIGKLIG